ncbi:hypothetical protein Tco_1317749 [Tanacetum coccineum]
MHTVPPPITGTYMPSPYQSDIEETQVNYGSKSDNSISDTISESNDFVSCDNSDKSSDSETHASCDSSPQTQTKDIPPAVDIQTLPESDVEDPNSTTGSPSFSCSENISPAIRSVPAGRSDSLLVENRPAVHSTGSRIFRQHPFPAGRSEFCLVETRQQSILLPVPFLPSSWCTTSILVGLKDQKLVSLVDQVPAGWTQKSCCWVEKNHNSDQSSCYIFELRLTRLLLEEKKTTFLGIQSKGGYSSTHMEQPSTDNEHRHCKIWSWRWKISEKAPYGLHSLTFENVYYVKSLQHFNSVSVSQNCDKKNKSSLQRTLIVWWLCRKEFQLPDASQVVLRIPRKHDLYTFHISHLQPELKVTCLVAKASLDESTRWHRRMAHVQPRKTNINAGVTAISSDSDSKGIDSAVRIPLTLILLFRDTALPFILLVNWRSDALAGSASIPTKRLNDNSSSVSDSCVLLLPVLLESRAHKSKFGESAFIGYVQDQQRTNHTDQLHCLSACFLSQLEPTSIAKALEDPDWVDANDKNRCNSSSSQSNRKHVPAPYWQTCNRDKRDFERQAGKPRHILERLRVPFSMEKLKRSEMSLSPKGFEDPYTIPSMYTEWFKAPVWTINKHLVPASRPDIMFAVSACSRHQVTLNTDISSECSSRKSSSYHNRAPKIRLVGDPKDSSLLFGKLTVTGVRDGLVLMGIEIHYWWIQFLGKVNFMAVCKKQDYSG